MPLVTLLLVAANVLAYLAELGAGGQATCATYGLIPANPELASIFSSMFLHDYHSIAHLAGNMFVLLVFGAIVELELGSVLFSAVFLISGIFGCLTHIAVNPSSMSPLIGASGAIAGVLAVAGALRPRLLGFVLGFVVLNMWHAVSGGAGESSFGAHLGGALAGVIFAAALRVTGADRVEA